MLIQDLNFFEPVEQISEIQGGKSSKAKSTKPGVSAKALAVGDKASTKASTKKVKASPKSKAASTLKKKSPLNGALNLKGIDVLHLDGLFIYFDI